MTKQEAIETFRKFRRCNTIGCNLVTDECENCIYSTEYSAIVEAATVAIECIEECIKHEETFEWCPDCKEYDQEHHCCHRWSKRIRETAKELEEFYKLESKGLVPQTTVRGLIGGKNNV